MEQIKRFLRKKGFALAMIACLLAAAAAGVWAVRTVREELKKSLEELELPDAGSQETLPGIDELLNGMEEMEWDQPETNAANSVADVPQNSLPSVHGGEQSSSGQGSGSGSVSEPSALRTDSGPASSSAAPASTQPVVGRMLNAYSGDELVYNKTLQDWRTHNGVDYACETGADVSAPTAGEVTVAGTEGNWGGVVSIRDDNGRVWRLCGVASQTVAVGEQVSVGQLLGKAGSIGCECAEESHVHLEVMEGETYLDPARLIR